MRSKLDPSQITQMTYDPASEAMKVKLQGLEMSVELNHADGDSVVAHPHKVQVSVEDFDADGQVIVPEFDCSSLSKIRIDVTGATGTFDIMASPTDTGNVFYKVSSAPAQVHEICARRLKVVSVNFTGNLHLVGKS